MSDVIEELVEREYAFGDPDVPVDIVELDLVYRGEEIQGPDGSRRIEVDR